MKKLRYLSGKYIPYNYKDMASLMARAKLTDRQIAERFLPDVRNTRPSVQGVRNIRFGAGPTCGEHFIFNITRICTSEIMACNTATRELNSHAPTTPPPTPKPPPNGQLAIPSGATPEPTNPVRQLREDITEIKEILADMQKQLANYYKAWS
jgi:hypothetical protein